MNFTIGLAHLPAHLPSQYLYVLEVCTSITSSLCQVLGTTLTDFFLDLHTAHSLNYKWLLHRGKICCEGSMVFLDKPSSSQKSRK